MKKIILFICFLLLSSNLLGQDNEMDVPGVFIRIDDDLYFIPIKITKKNKNNWNNIENLDTKTLKKGFFIMYLYEGFDDNVFVESKIYRNKIFGDEIADSYKYVRIVFAVVSYDKIPETNGLSDNGYIGKWDLKLTDKAFIFKHSNIPYKFTKVKFYPDLSKIPAIPEPEVPQGIITTKNPHQ